MDFKIGDRIRATRDYANGNSGWFKKGDEFTIDSVSLSHPALLTITTEGHGTGGFYLSDNYFEKESDTVTQDATFGEITVTNGVPVKGTGRNRYVVAREFGNELVVDLRARNSTNADTHNFIDKLVAGATAANKTVRYVDNLPTFFDPKARYTAFVKSGFTDAQGVSLTEDEIAALKLVETIKEKFKTIFAAETVTPPKPAYQKAPVPENMEVLRGLNFRKTSISNGSYRLTNTQAKAVWLRARELWRETPETRSGRLARDYHAVRANGINYTLEVYPNRVEIGCQSIPRYRLEAIAEKMGWDF